jgi:YfiH family protein
MSFIELFKDIPCVKAVTTTVGFNACYYAGADLEQVAADKAKLASYMVVPVDRVYIPRQVHSANVAQPGDDLENIDAMVTDRRDCVIAINTADCLPLLLVDPEAGVIAAIHCGWRGTVAHIIDNAVARMIRLGATPANIRAAIGPCIGPECFEVGEEVASQFPASTLLRSPASRRPSLSSHSPHSSLSSLPSQFLQKQTIGGAPQSPSSTTVAEAEAEAVQYAKPHVDLGKAVALQLTALGVPAEAIPAPLACSVCDPRFHSVRREGRALPYRTLTALRLLPK